MKIINLVLVCFIMIILSTGVYAITEADCRGFNPPAECDDIGGGGGGTPTTTCSNDQAKCEGLCDATWFTVKTISPYAFYDGTTPSCCGDAGFENAILCSKDPNLGRTLCTSNDIGCCPMDSDCIKTGTRECISHNTIVDLSLSGNDKKAICRNRQWQDCDTALNFCSYPYTESGESSPHGEYLSGDDVEACGDDSGEYYIVGFGARGTACCNSASDKLDLGGNCCVNPYDQNMPVNCYNCDGDWYYHDGGSGDCCFSPKVVITQALRETGLDFDPEPTLWSQINHPNPIN